MKHFVIKSKIYMQPKANKALIVVISICVIITAICGLISVLRSGVKIGNISPILLSLSIGIVVFSKSNQRPYYAFDVANVDIGEAVFISYQQSDLHIAFVTNSINTLQYSDQLACLRIVGNYSKTENKKVSVYENMEYLLYVGDGEENQIIDEIEKATNVEVKYMDRH